MSGFFRSSRFEHASRAKVRAALRADHGLRRLARRAPKRSWSQRPFAKVGARLMLSGLLGVLVAVVARPEWPVAMQSAMVALWFMLSSITLRFHLIGLLYELQPLTALSLLPASSAMIFRWNRRRIWLQLWRPFADSLAMLVVIATIRDAGWTGWLVVAPLAFLSASVVLACSVWLTFVPVPTVALLLPVAVPVLCIVMREVDTIADWATMLIVRHCERISLILPGGWTARAYLSVLTGNDRGLLALLLPAVALAGSVVWALRRWERLYRPEVFALWHSFGEPPPEWKEEVNAYLADQPRAPGPTELTMGIEAREFLQPPFFNGAPWLDRFIGRLLTDREQAILELAALRAPRWTRRAVWGAALVGLGLLSIWGGQRTVNSIVEGAAIFGGGFSIVLGVLIGLPFVSGFTRAYAPVNCFGTLIPFLAAFPVTIQELDLIALKAGLVRGLIFAPVTAAAGGLLSVFFGASASWGVAAGLKLAVLSIVAIPWFQAANNANGTNDTSRVTWRSLIVLLVLGLSFLGLAGAGVASIFAAGAWTWLTVISAAGSSFGGAFVYRLLHDRMWFDLMRTSSP